MSSSLRRTLVTAAKLALAVAILGYLIAQARDGFAELPEQSIHWPLLVAGLLCTLVAASLSFVRWHLLIRAQAIPISLPETLSLGALGLALNFVSLGSIGGDFFKAIFLAHGQPGRRTEAVATVVADRVLGLLTMLALASGGILATGLASATSVPVRVLCQTILASTAVCWTGAALLLFIPTLSGVRVRKWVESIPLLGGTAARLLGAVHAYRAQRHMLLAAFSISVVMALFFVTSFYLVARGLPVNEPTWAEHLVIAPTAGLVGAIPITPSGLGTTELAVEELYETMPGGAGSRKGDGTMVALARRATEVAVALIGLVFYLTHLRKMREVYAEAEEAADIE
ncbi:MAG: flippase-like domain-containing protein [Planctomycetes bacterium]|nr:flippase-like domain-containing protein [Planctomycetota bacterium]